MQPTCTSCPSGHVWKGIWEARGLISPMLQLSFWLVSEFRLLLMDGIFGCLETSYLSSRCPLLVILLIYSGLCYPCVYGFVLTKKVLMRFLLISIHAYLEENWQAPEWKICFPLKFHKWAQNTHCQGFRKFQLRRCILTPCGRGDWTVLSLCIWVYHAVAMGAYSSKKFLSFSNLLIDALGWWAYFPRKYYYFTGFWHLIFKP